MREEGYAWIVLRTHLRLVLGHCHIDELQNMDILALRGVIVALHHAAQESLPLYLVGSGLPTIRGLIGKSKTYAERMFNYAELGALNEAEVADAVAGPMRESGVSMDDEAVAEVFAQSRGYPYFSRSTATSSGLRRRVRE